jgi:dipeptidyl aminopeptidase/acylaminoacyl peptidase
MKTRFVFLSMTIALIAAVASFGSSAAASTAVASSGVASSAAVIAPPKGLPAFYSVPQPLPKTIGTLLKFQKVAVSGVDGTMYRVMYVSESETGHPVPVTGVIAVPNGIPPAGGFPVVTWGHGTNGMADVCAPSLSPDFAVPETNALLDQGWVVTASDYQGEGTPGLLPYLAGVSAARNTIDIVRAARHLPAAHASNRYVVWGHSEGGQTAMFALNIGASYAPTLKLQGVVAGAPPSQFSLIYTFLKSSPYRYYLLMAAGGFNVAYGNTLAPLGQVLTPLGMKYIADLGKGCSDYLAQQLDNVPTTSLVKADPFTVPAWKKLLMANDPENFTKPAAAPLLIIQGGNDEQIPVVSTQILAKHLCTIGQDLERWIYPGQSHAGVIGPSADDMIHWIADRFAGGSNPDPYAPTGLAGIGTTVCPS